MDIIEIHIHKPNQEEAELIRIKEDDQIITILEAISPDGHEELEIYIEGSEKPLPRESRVHEHGIKHHHKLHCRPKEHAHHLIIIVEGSAYEWSKRGISYAEVVTLFDPEFPKHPEITYSVRYKDGPHRNHEGILPPGDSVEVKNKMVFNVSRTGQS